MCRRRWLSARYASTLTTCRSVQCEHEKLQAGSCRMLRTRETILTRFNGSGSWGNGRTLAKVTSGTKKLSSYRSGMLREMHAKARELGEKKPREWFEGSERSHHRHRRVETGKILAAR